MLNKQYQSQFTQERLDNIPVEPDIPDNITIRKDGVTKLLKNLKPFKAAGPDNISPWTLTIAAEELSPALTKIFQLSLDSGIIPQDWLCANISPFFKKGDRSKPSNYRSVNLTVVCSKVFGHILHTNIMKHLDTHKVLFSEQHGFRKGHSCKTQLISAVYDIATELENKQQVNMVVMDFQKAFNKVPHQRLLIKLQRYGIRGKTLNWIRAFLTNRKQRVVVEGETSEWVKVDSSVPQGTSPAHWIFCSLLTTYQRELKEKCVYLLMTVFYTCTTPSRIQRMPKNYKKTWIDSHSGRISGK